MPFDDLVPLQTKEPFAEKICQHFTNENEIRKDNKR